MSLPNQYSAEGSRVRRAGASAVGSTVPSSGAKTAIATMTSSRNPPMAMVGWRRTMPSRPFRAFTGGSTSGIGAAAATPWGGTVAAGGATSGAITVAEAISGRSSLPDGRASSVPDPRVEQGVHQVDRQVDQHVNEAEQQDHALDHR